jgi:acid stress-induced BolA-like protein IbaG/YrbA
MVTPDMVKNYIATGLQCDHIEVEGDGQHFYATIVSPEFRGLMLVKQQQKVYAVLGDRMKAEIHALSMKTYTPERWAEMKG